MELKTKQAILKYFKNCIEEDSKESLKINLDNSKSSIYFPGKEDDNFDEFLNFSYDENQKNTFYQTLGINIESFDNDFLNGFFINEKINFDKTNQSLKKGGKYDLNKYISFKDNTTRQKILNKLSIYKKLLSLESPSLEKEDLKSLFFSPDHKSNGIAKIDFKPNLDFLDFYDNNKNESFYLILEYIKVFDEDNELNIKENVITPLYLIGLEINSNENGSFTLSLKESEPEFLYNIKTKNKKNIFPFYSSNPGDDGFKEMEDLENNIKGITSSFKEKINYYKSKLSQDIIQENEIIFNPCIISGANNVSYIKNLISDYNGIIKEEKKLENLKDSSLGLLFNENLFKESKLNNLILNITQLNKEQANIVQKSLSQNISVVIGPPGTGKSQVVLNLLANIYSNNKTVIFASKNNTAVDTVVEKFEKIGFPFFPFLRLGNKNSSQEWSGKILGQLNKESGIHKEYESSDIKNQKEKINGIYESIDNIEKEYLQYYQEYEKFELLLGEIADEELKSFLYKVLPLNIDFKEYKSYITENRNLSEDIKSLEQSIMIKVNSFEELKNKTIEKGGIGLKEHINEIIKKDIKSYKNTYKNNTEKYNILIQEIENEILYNNGIIEKVNNENSQISKSIEELEVKIIENNKKSRELRKEIIKIGGNQIGDNYSKVISIDIEKYKNIYLDNTNKYNKSIDDIEKEILKNNNSITKTRDEIKIISNNLINFIFNDNFLSFLINKSIDYKYLQDEAFLIKNKFIDINKSLNENDIYEYFNKKISNNILENILEKGNFIDYEDNLVLQFKKIQRDFNELNEYGWFKTFLGIKNKDFKKVYNTYLDIINLQKNSEIKKYFINIKQSSSVDSSDILDKIEEILLLDDYEKVYNNYTKGKSDLNEYETLRKNYIEKLNYIFGEYYNDIHFSSISQEISNISKIESVYKDILKFNENIDGLNQKKSKGQIEYESFLTKLSNNLFINLNNLNHNQIIEVFDLFIESKKTIQYTDKLNTNIENYKNEIISNTSKIEKVNQLIKQKKQEKQNNINEYNDFLSKLKSEFYIDFPRLNEQVIISLFDYLIKLQGLNSSIKELNNEKQKSLYEYESFKTNIFSKIEIVIGKEFLSYINKKYSKSIYPILEQIISLEKLNKVKNNINKLSKDLKGKDYNISELSKILYEEKNVFEKLSINYLSYQIFEKIKNNKPVLKDAIDGIYNAYSRIGKDIYNFEKSNIFYKKMYEKLFGKINIFVTTNQSTGNLPLEKGFYDYLIIDEASQNDLASIIPLMYRCKNLIVIGDPNQLQNITKLKEENVRQIFDQKLKEVNIESKKYEYEFKHIYNFGKSDNYNLSAFNSINHIYNGNFNRETFALREHYRCFPDIINFSNEIINDYNLFPKNYIKNSNINPQITPLGIHWFKNIKAKDTEKTKQNEEEAKEIIEYLKELNKFYGNKITIGVISPYRNQVNLLNNLWNSYLRQSSLGDTKNILIDTVHKFQGDEKDIILYSPVYPKSNLWNDKNLLNVALSRAKSGFYIFGDKNAFGKMDDEKGENLMKKLINYIDVINKQKEGFKINKFDTEYEKVFFEELKKSKIKFDFHVLENNGKYELDFKLKLKGFNGYLNIEIDGNSHDNKKSYDYTRNVIVEKLGYKVIRYTNKYLMANMQEIINNLKKVCEIE